jgi:hypothetical protein
MTSIRIRLPARQRVLGLASAFGLALLATACEAPEPGERSPSRSEAPGVTRPSSEGAVALARVEGQTVTAADFQGFVERVRFPGYRPATVAEARRLLEAQLGELLLQEEGAAGRIATDAADRVIRYRAERRRSFQRADRLAGARVSVDAEALAQIVTPIDPGRPPTPPSEARSH